MVTQVRLDISAEHIAALETRTKGWIAGLELVAVSMSGRHNDPSLIKSFTGSHRCVLDYLIEEVLDQQRRWYSYRQLFADLLCQRLRQHQVEHGQSPSP